MVLPPLEERFDRARSISEKLARYADVERRYRKLETELRELEQDPDVARALGIEEPAPEQVPEPEEAGQVEGSAVGTESHGSNGTEERRWQIPRSPSGRIQRGFLDEVFPKVADLRFDRELTISEMRDIVSEELGEEISRSSVQTLVRRALETGHMEFVGGSSPERYVWRLPAHPSGLAQADSLDNETKEVSN